MVAANLIKDKIYRELGFTVNIGVSNNKLLAKMASDFKKPNLVHTLFPNEIKKKMWPLPVGDLFFCGRATEKKLKSIGITTIGELARADVGLLKSILKKHGEESVFRATYINGPIRPLNGGISKEKFRADGEEVYYE